MVLPIYRIIANIKVSEEIARGLAWAKLMIITQ